MSSQKKSPKYIFIPGLGNSTGDHWQCHWRNQVPGSIWLEQEDWQNPDRDAWVECLNEAVLAINGPVLFITHSLGGSTLAEWSRRYVGDVAGAFMVAVPDCLRPDFPNAIKGYGDVPDGELPFHSLMVISSDDPYGTQENALKLAGQWGSEAVVVGNAGHINANSGLGDWQVGKNLFSDFLSKLGFDSPF